MKIVSYVVCKNSQDFEEWQLKNLDHQIISVSPFVGNVSGQQRGTDNNCDFNLNVPVNVFVTYFKEV